MEIILKFINVSVGERIIFEPNRGLGQPVLETQIKNKILFSSVVYLYTGLWGLRLNVLLYEELLYGEEVKQIFGRSWYRSQKKVFSCILLYIFSS